MTQSSVEIDVKEETFKTIAEAVLASLEKIPKKSENILPHGERIRSLKPFRDKVLAKLHEEVCKTYFKYRDSGFNDELKYAFQGAKSELRNYVRLREREHYN